MAVLLSTSDLLKSGWTSALIRKLLGDPDETEPFQRGFMRGVRHWYEKSRVDAAASTPDFAAFQERRKARREAPDRRRREFSRRYQNWRGALPDACHFLHSLNRFCKHRACSLEQRSEIYDLKNRMVELLYRAGYCTACWIHTQILPAKPCRECFGSGDEGNCERCDGSGNYLPAKTVRFYVFRFALGKGYTWHQPDRLVTFPATTTREPEAWGGVEREKPIGLDRSEFAAAKDLLRWVLERSAVAVPEPEAQHEWATPAPTAAEGWIQDALF